MKTRRLRIDTRGNCDIIDITGHIDDIVKDEQIQDGILFLNVVGSTAGITTMEYEPGLSKDVPRLLDAIIPYKKDWAHNATWNDDNGHAHLRSMVIKTNFFVTVTSAELDLGTWQQVVLLDFDTRPRQREVVVKIIE